MTTKNKLHYIILYIEISVILTLFSNTTLANPYVTAGDGFTNVGNYMGTIGVGFKVNEWLRVEADHRIFTKTSENDVDKQVGPLLLVNDGASPPNYSCDPNCHNEHQVFDVKTTGNVFSALFTTESSRAYAYVRIGIMFRTDEMTMNPINVYNSANSSYTNAGSQTTSISSTEKILGIGVSGHGFYMEITQYGSYPGIYINHDFFTSSIGYRLDL